MTHEKMSKTLLERVEKANAKGNGYTLPESYNTTWATELSKLLEKDMLKENKSRGKAKGFWLTKKSK